MDFATKKPLKHLLFLQDGGGKTSTLSVHHTGGGVGGGGEGFGTDGLCFGGMDGKHIRKYLAILPGVPDPRVDLQVAGGDSPVGFDHFRCSIGKRRRQLSWRRVNTEVRMKQPLCMHPEVRGWTEVLGVTLNSK